MWRKGKRFRRSLLFVLICSLLCCMCVTEQTNRASALSRPTVTVKERKKTTATIKMTSKSKVTTYQIYLKKGTKGKWSLNTFLKGKRTLKLTKLKSKETYYVKVRSVYTVGTRFSKSSFSKAKKIPAYQTKKKSTPTPKPTVKPTAKPANTGTPAAPAPTTAPMTDAEKAEAETYVNEVFRLVNEERTKAGLAPYTLDSVLCQAAEKRAGELITRFDHTRPDGSKFSTVLGEFDHPYQTAAENIAAGQSSPSQVMVSWMNSAGHRANILNAACTKMGVGYYKTNAGYRYYWVQLFSD